MLDLTQDALYNFVFVIDVSESMRGNPLQETINAYISLTESLIIPEIPDFIQFAIIPFSSDASLHAPLKAEEAISTVQNLSVGDFTNFNAALTKANEFLSTVSPEATNIVYFLSDGFSTTGGDFTQQAKALQAVAEVQAYGFGLANNQVLNIIDSDGNSVIVSEPSELAAKFLESTADLIATIQDNITETTTSVTENEASGEKTVENSNEQTSITQQNAVDNSVTENPQTLANQESDNTVVNNIDASADGEVPVVSFEDISIKEGDTGNSIAQFAVNLSSPATKEVKFSYQTVDGSAISSSDYNEISGEILIPVGETSANIDIEVNGDTQVESNEEFTLNLFGLSGATFENNQAEYSKVAVVENDDFAQSSSIVPQNVAQNTQIPDNGNILDGNLLNLESFAGNVAINFNVGREAELDNTVGFYKIEDTQGTIKDPVTGNTFVPSDGEAYVQLALQIREPGLELSVNNLSSITVQDTLLGGSLYAPIAIADGNFDSLEGDFSQVYFPFAQANPDNLEHFLSQGNNSLGFEDLLGGGDMDYDDLVVSVKIA